MARSERVGSLPDPWNEAATRRVRIGLLVGAAIWLFLLVVGFFAPGGWVWGLPGPVGHSYNFMISLWFVGLVLAPGLASRAPFERTAAIQVYLLAVLGMCVSSIRGEPPEWISDAPIFLAAAISIGLVLWAHPERGTLLRV